MLNTFVRLRESAYRLRNNERGVVSFEYVVVAALVIAAVGAAFSATGFGAVLSGAITRIGTTVTNYTPVGGG